MVVGECVHELHTEPRRVQRGAWLRAPAKRSRPTPRAACLAKQTQRLAGTQHWLEKLQHPNGVSRGTEPELRVGDGLATINRKNIALPLFLSSRAVHSAGGAQRSEISCNLVGLLRLSNRQRGPYFFSYTHTHARALCPSSTFSLYSTTQTQPYVPLRLASAIVVASSFSLPHAQPGQPCRGLRHHRVRHRGDAQAPRCSTTSSSPPTPTQYIRRSLLQKHARIRNCLTQLYTKDITADDKQELDEPLQREPRLAGLADHTRKQNSLFGPEERASCRSHRARWTVQGEVIEHSFGEEHLCFRTLQRFTAATLEHGMNPPLAPKPEWRTAHG